MEPAQHAANNFQFFCHADCIKSRRFPSKMQYMLIFWVEFYRFLGQKWRFLQIFFKYRLKKAVILGYFHEI